MINRTYDPNWNNLESCRVNVREAMQRQAADVQRGLPARPLSNYQHDVAQERINETHHINNKNPW